MWDPLRFERPAVSPSPLGKGKTPGIPIAILRTEFPKEKLHDNGDLFPTAKRKQKILPVESWEMLVDTVTGVKKGQGLCAQLVF